MTDFQIRHVNRLLFPMKRILICEDDLENQMKISNTMLSILPPQGKTTVSFVTGGIEAAAIISHLKVDLILLDHDMPYGNGSDLIEWLAKDHRDIPILTFSGIPENNNHMEILATQKGLKVYKAWKFDVIEGKQNKLIMDVLG